MSASPEILGCGVGGSFTQLPKIPEPSTADISAGGMPQCSDFKAAKILASDAHAVPHLEFDSFACAIAMRAGVPRERILNVCHADEFQEWLADR
jgi:hypothetical protein